MAESVNKNLGSMKLGMIFALLTIGYGFGLGGVFGVYEDDMKACLNTKAKAVLVEKYDGDEVEMKRIADKSWTYIKRSHFHATGLGAIAVGLILLMAFLRGSNWFKGIAALFLGVGSLGYSIFWILAGLRAPGMGSTGAAKESLKLLAQPTAGLCFIGFLMVLVLMLVSLKAKKE